MGVVVPLPPPLTFLVFIGLRRICAQILAGVGLTCKFLSAKELDRIFGGWTGTRAGAWVKKRERSGPITGQSTWLAMEVASGCAFEGTALPHRASGQSGLEAGVNARTQVTVLCDRSRQLSAVSPLAELIEKGQSREHGMHAGNGSETQPRIYADYTGQGQRHEIDLAKTPTSS